MRQKSKERVTNFWLKQYILLGYAAKGTVYLLIGVSAIQAAVFSGEEATGTYLTLALIADKPLGKILILVLAVALMGYVLRRFLQAIFVPGITNSSSWKCILKRVGYIMSGLSYMGVSHTSVSLALGLGEYDDTIEDLADQLFELPFGEWLIFIAGIAIATIGVFYVFGAYTGSYISEFNSSDIHYRLEKWTVRIAKIGVAARGIAFILMGIFFIQAAIIGSSEFAGGLQNVFRLLAVRPLGWLWLGSFGAGLIGYGLYMFVATRYRLYAIR